MPSPGFEIVDAGGGGGLPGGGSSNYHNQGGNLYYYTTNSNTSLPWDYSSQLTSRSAIPQQYFDPNFWNISSTRATISGNYFASVYLITAINGGFVPQIPVGVVVFKNADGGIKLAYFDDESGDYSLSSCYMYSRSGTRQKCSGRNIEPTPYFFLFPYNGTYYFIRIFQEVSTTDVRSITLTDTSNPSKTTFEPLETISTADRKRSVSIYQSIDTYDSNGYSNSASTTSAEVTAFNSSYDTTGNKSYTYTKTYYQNGSQQREQKSWSITISDWQSITYSIQSNGANYTYKIYTCLEVGQDFLNAFSIYQTNSNSYGSVSTKVKSSLELSKMSKTVVGDGDLSFSFQYDVSDLSGVDNDKINSPTFTTFVHLASGNAKFANFSRIIGYALNSTISVDNLGDLEDNYLTYEDGATVPISNITNIQGGNFVMECSLGSLPIVVDSSTSATFSITYHFVSPYFPSNSQTNANEYILTDSCYVDNDIADHIVMENFQHVFNQNERISASNDAQNPAQLRIYNSNGAEVSYSPVTQANFSQYIDANSKSALYGQNVNDNLQDGKITLSFTVSGILCEQEICFVYDEPSLLINSTNAQKQFYFDADESPFTFDFDYTNVVVKKKRHTNSYSNGTVTTTITETDVTSSCVFSHNDIDKTKSSTYRITISYTNEFGIATNDNVNFYEVVATPITPISLEADLIDEQDDSTLHYWDSGVSKFQIPTDLQFNLLFNNNDEEPVDIDDIVFFRTAVDMENDEEITTDDYVLPSAGNRIYFKDSNSGLSGSYGITFDTDNIDEVNFKNTVTIFKGNKLNNARVMSQVILVLSYDSGRTPTEMSSGFGFVNPDTVILSDPLEKLSVIIDGTTYEVENSLSTAVGTKIAYSNPYAVISVDLSNFPTEYNNGTDVIDPSRISAKTTYYETRTGSGTQESPYVYSDKCDFEQTLTYTSAALSDSLHFNASIGVSGDAFYNEYTLGTKLDIDMDGQATQSTTLTLAVQNRFNSTSATLGIGITAFEILNITGIKLLEAKTEYNVGETFLNEEDHTRIMVFYTGADEQEHTYEIELRQGMTGLNVYPLAGTLFNVITNDKVVTITSATNSEVMVQYNINVKPKYVYGNTTTHNLVAVKFDTYTIYGNGGIIELYLENKYMLVERNMILVNGVETYLTDGDKESTEINSSGFRVPKTGYGYNDLVVRGYLDNVRDITKFDAGKVILFKDYIPPVKGSNNIIVKFPYYIEGSSDYINKCHFGILFGNNNAKNRLFVSGNENIKNCDWYSGVVNEYTADNDDVLNGNFGYFEDSAWCYYGETDNKVIGYDIVSNDKLLVLKDHSDKETTVYFRTPVLVNALDSSGTQMLGTQGESLYQDEFSLVKGNNSVAGVSPKSIINFNGDTLFLSKEKQLVGLDLTGIIGDNQRYANSRSRYIDEDLRNQDLDGAFLWSNNKYLFLILKNKIYVTHYELKGENNQYEWFVIDVANVSSVLEKDDVIYFGDVNGNMFKFNDTYRDANKIFAGYGQTQLSANPASGYELIIAAGYLDNLDSNKKYFFKPVPFDYAEESDEAPANNYIYYSLGSIKNNSSADCDFYVDNADTRNVLQLVCRENGSTNQQKLLILLQRISEKTPVFLNRIDSGTNGVIVIPNTTSGLDDAWGERFYLKEYDVGSTKHLYQLLDGNGNIMQVKDLVSARLCLRVVDEKEMVIVDASEGKFNLKSEGEILDIVQYDSQELSNSFRGEIIEYGNVEAYYITNPYVMGNLETTKTVWSWTLTNDSNIPSELDLCYANNKIPYEKMKTLAKVSKATLGFSFDTFNFAQVDFDKNIVPRTYTSKRILSGVKFLCFAFRNYNDTNCVLSSMTITYTLPYPSYGGD